VTIHLLFNEDLLPRVETMLRSQAIRIGHFFADDLRSLLIIADK